MHRKRSVLLKHLGHPERRRDSDLLCIPYFFMKNNNRFYTFFLCLCLTLTVARLIIVYKYSIYKKKPKQ